MQTRPAIVRFALAFAALAPVLAAQHTLDAPPPSHDVVFAHDSGGQANNSGAAAVVISFQARVQGAPWMRLFFSRVELAGDPRVGNASILRLTSLYDAQVQELDARSLRDWSNSSAYFNGESVLVEVLAHPDTGDNRVILDHATAGLPITGNDAACGIDLRIASFDGRGARLLPPGCTAWIISDCKSCFLSAGHCVASGMVAQFNVPLSTGGGGLVHPPVEDQFPIDSSSIQSQNQGVGWDWAYFGGLNNNLGETPLQHQLARWSTSATPPFNSADVIRVTGYGVDVGSANQTQQTVTGTWTNLSMNFANFSTYVEGGNSGSPMIHEKSGLAIGVVTHTSCLSSTVQQNYATRMTQVAFATALANPLGVCAGSNCNAVGLAYCPTGPLMSVISATGSASVSANDLVLHANNVPTNKSGLFFLSRDKQSLPFGNSTLCVGGGGFPIRRLPTVNSGATTRLVFPVNLNNLPAGEVLAAGDVAYFQAWFRTGASGTETSNGLQLDFVP